MKYYLLLEDDCQDKILWGTYDNKESIPQELLDEGGYTIIKGEQVAHSPLPLGDYDWYADACMDEDDEDYEPSPF